MSWSGSPWVYPLWDYLGFLDLGDYFLPHFREVSNYYLLKYFLMVFLFVFFFWDSYDSMLGCLTLSWRSLRLSSFLLIRFSCFLSDSFISTILSSISLILSLPPLFYYLLPPECFWSHLLHYSLYVDSSLFILGPC